VFVAVTELSTFKEAVVQAVHTLLPDQEDITGQLKHSEERSPEQVVCVTLKNHCLELNSVIKELHPKPKATKLFPQNPINK